MSTRQHSHAVSLTPCRRYYAKVTAVNAAGLSASLLSGPIVADATPATPGTVLDGSEFFDAECLYDDTTFTATFTPFGDTTSGVRKYEVSAGTAPGSDDVLAWTDTRLDDAWSGAATVRFKAPALPVGSTVFVSVRAQNNAGWWSVASSNGAEIRCSGGTGNAACVAMASASSFCINAFTCPAGGCVAAGEPGDKGGKLVFVFVASPLDLQLHSDVV